MLHGYENLLLVLSYYILQKKRAKFKCNHFKIEKYGKKLHRKRWDHFFYKSKFILIIFKKGVAYLILIMKHYISILHI